MSSKKIILAIIICVVAGAILYLFTPIGTGNHSLNERQIESLCTAIAGEPESEFDSLDATCQAAVKIFGVKNNGDFKTIFGYVSEGQYVKHKDKAYDVSGGNYEFMADVTVNGDNVEIVKTYGDGVSSESTYEEMPFRYRFKISNYDAYDSNGYCKVAKEADKKAEKILGVPVETKYTLSIDGDKYEIYDIDTEGNMDIIETGNADDL